MGFQRFDRFSWCIGFVFFVVLSFVVFGVGVLGFWLLCSVSSVEFGIFVFDAISFYLGILSVFLGLSLLFSLGDLSMVSKIMLFLSVVFSILCYCCIHALCFWFFYELSILPLLFLLILESPYSERFIAS